jgi:hypothetical protein
MVYGNNIKINNESYAPSLNYASVLGKSENKCLNKIKSSSNYNIGIKYTERARSESLL